ncbi:MAG: dynamin family protein [Gammaproteobacteria bacterium]|nr:dynamin family protein [Gammaproteobacteria bacterium]
MLESTHSAALDKHLGELNRWKGLLKKTIIEYYAWLKKHRLLSVETEEQLRAAIHAINTDELTIALVAEFSRGKTNLINAIFFADFGRQLLPSTAGRTTMCPVEMFYDRSHDQPYLRVLPIDTLLDPRSLTSFKEARECWQEFPLDLSNPEQLQQVLMEVRLTKQVPLAEAHRLGLAMDNPDQPGPSQDEDLVEIPKWRHALLNYPHPLMKKGLRVVETPGLNALGSEPELIFGLLPTAQVILFVLGADTGVTSSDLKIWQNHIRAYQQQRRQAVIVALNKIDMLWDELQTDEEVDRIIARQRLSTAQLLELPEQAVFPVSAHKALVAKIKQDERLLARSGLSLVEEFLSQDLLVGRRNTLVESYCSGIGHMIDNSLLVIEGKLEAMQAQRRELFELSGQSNAMIGDLLEETLQQKKRHQHNINELLLGQKELERKSAELAQILSLEAIDQLIAETQQRMQGSWTTGGLKKAMQLLFDQLNSRMIAVTNTVDQSRDLLQEIYRRFEGEEGFSLGQPRSFSVMKHRVKLDMLYQEAEAFRNSAATALSAKNTVIQRFFTALADQARALFAGAAEDSRGNWIPLALEPLKYQIRDHRDLLDRKIGDLKKIAESRDTLTERIKELHRTIKRHKTELEKLQEMQKTIRQLSNQRPD